MSLYIALGSVYLRRVRRERRKRVQPGRCGSWWRLGISCGRLYLNKPGLRVGKSGGVLQVKEKDSLVQEIRVNEICQVNLMGNIQISTLAEYPVFVTR
jgi:CRISPR associated protein, Cas1 family